VVATHLHGNWSTPRRLLIRTHCDTEVWGGTRYIRNG
jgi:hypothetical protein